jgi:Response regulators consisting of a CheY-like receiver domain and a winged-helix DNA-binding domain
MRVLVVEDDEHVRHWLGCKLRACGHACRLVESGECALRSIEKEAFDVVVLDRMLPRMNGLEVLSYLNGRPHPPVMILSALDGPEERVDGLRAGADDYLGKPFHFSELLVRLEVLAKRQNRANQDENLLIADDLVMNTVTREVHRGGERLDLTDKEFKLLQVFMLHKGQTVTRAMLLEKVWGYNFDPQTNLIDVHMSKLRTKIDKDHDRPLLRTIRSVGYVLG